MLAILFFLLAAGAFVFTRGGAVEEAAPVLPSLIDEDSALDGEDAADDGDDELNEELGEDGEPISVEVLEGDELDEPIDEDLELELEDSSATGIDPLTGRPIEIDADADGEDDADLVAEDEALSLDTDGELSEDDEGDALELVDESAVVTIAPVGRDDANNGQNSDPGRIIVTGTGNGINNGFDTGDVNTSGDVVVIVGEDDRNGTVDSGFIINGTNPISTSTGSTTTGSGGPAAYVVINGGSGNTNNDRNDVDYNGGYLLGQNGVADNGSGVQVFINPERSDPEFEGETETFAAPTPQQAPITTTMAQRADVGAAEDLLAQWLDAENVAGARIGLSFPDGSTALISAGETKDGDPIDPNAEFLATSITKTLTASIIFDLISEGQLQLDMPAPDLAAFPEFGHASKMTIRQLLQHTSGLASYQASPNWEQGLDLDPIGALALADDVPLEHAPGAERGYSNSGYLYLGLLAEQYTSTSYSQLVNDLITNPVGMTSTRIDDVERAGWVGYSAGGLVSTIPDLLKWGSALYRDGSILEKAQLDSMLDVNNEHATGLGANVICPCGLQDGQIWYTSIGHDGGSVTLQHSPSDDMITAAKFTESFWTSNLTQVEVHRLLRELRSIVAPT